MKILSSHPSRDALGHGPSGHSSARTETPGLVLALECIRGTTLQPRERTWLSQGQVLKELVLGILDMVGGFGCSGLCLLLSGFCVWSLGLRALWGLGFRLRLCLIFRIPIVSTVLGAGLGFWVWGVGLLPFRLHRP